MPASSGLCSQARVRRPDGAAGHAVGFVASAGGVVALGDVLRGLPADLDAAVIVVLHLLPDHRSHLAEILARQDAPAGEGSRGGDLLEPGWVYVAPPDAHLVVEAGATLSLRAGPPVRYLRPSGDVLLESLAERVRRQLPGRRAHRARAATAPPGREAVKEGGRDGTRPGRGDGGVLRRCRSAAIDAGLVDRVLPLDEIAPAVVDFVAHAMTDIDPAFESLLEFLRDGRGVRLHELPAAVADAAVREAHAGGRREELRRVPGLPRDASGGVRGALQHDPDQRHRVLPRQGGVGPAGART